MIRGYLHRSKSQKPAVARILSPAGVRMYIAGVPDRARETAEKLRDKLGLKPAKT